MSIGGLTQVASRGGTTAAGTENKIVGKDDFLHLLVAQLKSQDPLNPMDSTGFTAQLAQFSSLEQLQNINTTLNAMGISQSVSTNSQAVGFIGKTVTAVGNSVEISDRQAQPIQIDLSRDAYGSYVKIYDVYGNFVRQIEKGSLPAGQHSIAWDGRDYLGGSSPDGVYRFEVSAIDELGNSVYVTHYASGVVTGVTFRGGQAYLQCGNHELAMSNVVKVE
jgi:flagellar basal-body rod modification protein FlgD